MFGFFSKLFSIFSLDSSCSDQFFFVWSQIHLSLLLALLPSLFLFSCTAPSLFSQTALPPFGPHIQITSLDTDPSIPPNLSKMSILFLLGCCLYLQRTHPSHVQGHPRQAGRQSAYEISPWEYLTVKRPIRTYITYKHTLTQIDTYTFTYTYSRATQSLPGVSFHFLSHDQSNLAFI